MDLEDKIVDHSDHAVIRLCVESKSQSGSQCDLFKAQLLHLMELKMRPVLLFLGKVRTLSSKFVSTLLMFRKILKRSNLPFWIVDVSTAVKNQLWEMALDGLVLKRPPVNMGVFRLCVISGICPHPYCGKRQDRGEGPLETP